MQYFPLYVTILLITLSPSFSLPLHGEDGKEYKPIKTTSNDTVSEATSKSTNTVSLPITSSSKHHTSISPPRKTPTVRMDPATSGSESLNTRKPLSRGSVRKHVTFPENQSQNSEMPTAPRSSSSKRYSHETLTNSFQPASKDVSASPSVIIQTQEPKDDVSPLSSNPLPDPMAQDPLKPQTSNTNRQDKSKSSGTSSSTPKDLKPLRSPIQEDINNSLKPQPSLESSKSSLTSTSSWSSRSSSTYKGPVKVDEDIVMMEAFTGMAAVYNQNSDLKFRRSILALFQQRYQLRRTRADMAKIQKWAQLSANRWKHQKFSSDSPIFEALRLFQNDLADYVHRHPVPLSPDKTIPFPSKRMISSFQNRHGSKDSTRKSSHSSSFSSSSSSQGKSNQSTATQVKAKKKPFSWHNFLWEGCGNMGLGLTSSTYNRYRGYSSWDDDYYYDNRYNYNNQRNTDLDTNGGCAAPLALSVLIGGANIWSTLSSTKSSKFKKSSKSTSSDDYDWLHKDSLYDDGWSTKKSSSKGDLKSSKEESLMWDKDDREELMKDWSSFNSTKVEDEHDPLDLRKSANGMIRDQEDQDKDLSFTGEDTMDLMTKSDNSSEINGRKMSMDSTDLSSFTSEEEGDDDTFFSYLMSPISLSLDPDRKDHSMQDSSFSSSSPVSPLRIKDGFQGVHQSPFFDSI
ncbi:MAG: hypothetical protein DHS80DRAFT_21672 [Piptocephalis tieghemiana]|nr:MAG: hypothetical protein DHS80DRAFT_21672 [Piptocephalis tieghemiana]